MNRDAAALCVFLLLAGCPRRDGTVRAEEGERARPPVEARADPQADEALERARQLAQGQVPQKSVETLLEVRKRFPGTTASQHALYEAGVIAFGAKDWATARKAFNELLFENPLFENAFDAKLRLGLAALELKAYRDAYQTLSPLLENASGEDRRRLEEALARAAEGAGMTQETLRAALQQCETPEGQATCAARITELVEGRSSFLDVATARQELAVGHPAWPILTFKLARIYYHLRDWQRLEESLQELLREAPGSPFAQQAQELLERSRRRTQAKPKVVGLVLPMTGKYKPLGEAVMRGVQLALQSSDLELVVKDNEGDVNLSGKAVEELAFDEQAIAIIGPLLGDDSRRAALVAEELQVPILTLTRSEDITRIGPYVFRNMLTNSQQAEALADYATRVLGFKSFAVLYPNIPYGVELANSFWDEVQSRGGQVRGAESYDHDQTTYTTEVKKLVGRYYLEDRADYLERVREIQGQGLDPFRKRKALEKARSSLAPVVDFEALLIPDSWQRVGLVTPALAVEDIITNACDPRDLENIKRTTGRKELKTVTLLGTNQWSSPKGRSGVPELLERGGKHVMCSVYVDGFYVDSTRSGTRKFVHAYRDAYKDQRDPGLLEAVGFDAAGMVRRVIDRQAPRTRAELAVQLAALKDFEGATGRTSFNDRREAVKPLFFLSIEKTGVKELTFKERAPGM